MNKKEMRNRLEAGYEPIDVAIEKWHDIEYNSGVDEASGNCALCYAYNQSGGCYQCPLYQYLDGYSCDDGDASPYKRYCDDNETQPMIHALAGCKEWMANELCHGGTFPRNDDIGQPLDLPSKISKDKTYSFGQQLNYNGNVYMIVGWLSEARLVNLGNGQFWAGNKIVCLSTKSIISESELSELTGSMDDRYTLVE